MVGIFVYFNNFVSKFYEFLQAINFDFAIIRKVLSNKKNLKKTLSLN